MMDYEQFFSCIDACLRCAQECDRCAEACRCEPRSAELADCIRLNLDCAEFCRTAASLMSRESHFSGEVCRVCAEICDVCAADCQRHEHEHCQRSAAECHECGEECRRMTMAVIRA